MTKSQNNPGANRRTTAKANPPARTLKGKGNKAQSAQQSGVRHEIIAVLLLTLSVFLFIAVWKYGGVENSEVYIGWLGKYLMRGLDLLFGDAVIVLPIFIMGWAIHMLAVKQWWSLRMWGFVLLLISWLVYKSVYNIPVKMDPWRAASLGLGGGYIGGALGLGIVSLLGGVGTGILLVLTTLLSIIMTLNRTIVEMARVLWAGLKRMGAWFSKLIWIEEEVEEEMAEPKSARRRKEPPLEPVQDNDYLAVELDEPAAMHVQNSLPELLVPVVKESSSTGEQPAVLRLPKDEWSDKPELVEPDEAQELTTSYVTEALKEMPGDDVDSSVEPLPYRLPPLSLLSEVSGERNIDKKQIRDSIATMEETFASFGVGVRVNEVSCGPAVTRYELTPAPGVKVSRIISLTDDLQLSLAASGIRIEAPIPGKSAIGIEVPNTHIHSVGFKRLLNSPAFKKLQSPLSIVLGEDISGNPIVAKLSDMPHLLIAGSTGSGKSVCMNVIIMSLLYNAKPEDLKLVFIDPKMVELTGYNGIPHLLTPVVTDAKKASVILRWMTNEMEKRYKLFADTGVRDIYRYNQTAEQRLPFIVIMIDELADLMMVAPHEVEDSICRLAQMARAAGMHLIVATQRPSVDVVTGIIKANIPSRIAFAVSAQADSRTILDMGGAEKLMGRGDMLFFPVGSAKPNRVQGAFVGDADIEATVNHIKGQSSPDTLQEQSQQMENAMSHVNPEVVVDEWDELFWEAARILVETEKASISYLQRRLRIGFSRAARLVDMMEERGIVSAPDSNKKREILINAEELNDIMSRQSGNMI